MWHITCCIGLTVSADWCQLKFSEGFAVQWLKNSWKWKFIARKKITKKNEKVLRQIQSCTQIPRHKCMAYPFYHSMLIEIHIFSSFSAVYDVVVDPFPRHFIFLIPRLYFCCCCWFSFSVCGKTEAISICAGYFLLTLRWFSSLFFLSVFHITS